MTSEMRRKEAEEWETGFSFQENHKQMLHEQFWTHSIQE